MPALRGCLAVEKLLVVDTGLARRLRVWFMLNEAVDRRTYLVNGLVLVALKYGVDAAAVFSMAGKFWSPLDYLLPFYFLRAEKFAGAPAWFLPVLVVWTLPFMWIGVAMTLRRAVDAGRSPWLSLLFFVPFLNYALMLVLCALPTVPLRPWEQAEGTRVVDARLAVALYGIAAGLAVAIPTIIVNVYLLRRYSTSLFLGTPFTLGAVTAYVLNREDPRGVGVTMQVVSLSVVLLGGAILLFGLEGLLCIAMALPIAIALAILGGVFGRAIALHTPGRPAQLASLVLAVPVLAGLDQVRGIAPPYEVADAVVVDAPPETVWRHVVSFSELAPPGEALFRLGVAYPRRAWIEGTGRGAIRHCEFSTGTFIEPITRWEAPRRLSFDITEQPVPLRELSPRGAIDAPHLHGYFGARRGEFRLAELPGERVRTLLIGSTWYEIDIGPAWYWRMYADGIVSAIHWRVLEHIKQLSQIGS
ncbi:MAG: DUF805 domain-containing protein [Gemmatimonadales bacterium]